MIIEFREQDLENVMALWLETNIAAHSFIDSEYWKSNYDAVKAMMPSATIYIYKQNIESKIRNCGEEKMYDISKLSTCYLVRHMN